MFELVTEKNIDIAAEIHSISWKESHKVFCSKEFVEAHTKERQRQYIEKEMQEGKVFYILVEETPKGIVSIKDNLIENLYVLPAEQRKGYGTRLLEFAEILCKDIPTLWILSNNEVAKNLYLKQGYQLTGECKQLNDDLSELEMNHKVEVWFTVEAIDEDTYVISEYKHSEETHCYLLLGKDSALLIDTGLGVTNIQEVVCKITTLPVMVAVTHVHWDHIGGHKFFNNFAVHENELEWISEKFPLPLEVVKNNLSNKNNNFPVDFNIENYTIFQGKPKRILHDNDEIELGKRIVRVIHTPGHSPGHCCFYEEERKYLYSGDLIYKGRLDMFYPSTNPEDFLQSISKVNIFDIRRILPGHHSMEISTPIITEIKMALDDLKKDGNLEQGKGVYEFGDFQIHL